MRVFLRRGTACTPTPQDHPRPSLPRTPIKPVPLPILTLLC